LITPLVLSTAGEAELGAVLTAAGVGLVLGSLATLAYGTPARPTRTVAFAMLSQAMCLGLAAQPHLWALALGSFGFGAASAVINAYVRELWQRKVPKALSGRVAALRGLMTWVPVLVAYGVAGPVVDYLATPGTLLLGLVPIVAAAAIAALLWNGLRTFDHLNEVSVDA
jgi:MFS family permease